VPHFVGTAVVSAGNSFGAASGDFATVTTDLTAQLGVVLSGSSLSIACNALAGAR